METQKTNDTVNKKENKWSEWQLCLFLRISTASGRPKREFKPKSIRSSIETLDNNQHNGLTHSSSIRSTGTALTHTVTVFITSVFLFSFFCPDFSSHRHPLSFLLSLTDIQINNTVNGKSRYLFMKYSWSSECCRDLPPVYLLFMSLHVQYILIGNNMSSVTYTVCIYIFYMWYNIVLFLSQI